MLLLIIDVTSLQTLRFLTFDVDQGGKPAQSRNNTQSQAAARGMALFMRLTKYRSAATRRSFAAVVWPAGNFVVRQLKVSRGNSRTNRWNGRRRPSGASRRATLCVHDYVCLYVRVCVRPRVTFPKSLPQNGDRRAHIRIQRYTMRVNDRHIHAGTAQREICMCHTSIRTSTISRARGDANSRKIQGDVPSGSTSSARRKAEK